jgi:hypothetical protein
MINGAYARKFSHKMGSFLLLLTLVLGPISNAFAQETAGSIEGTIRDPQGNVVPGISLTVTSRGSVAGARPDASVGFRRTLNTDENGFFRVLEVPPGFYTVTTASTSGFGTATINDIEVVLGKATPVNITLQAGNIEESVTVTGDSVAIDPTDNKIQTNITNQVIELLPKGTNFTSLLKVSPATRPEPAAAGFQVDGASGAENTFIIDGQEVTNFRTGQINSNFNLPFQLVQEVQVKSSGFEAEFGGATGGVINLVTKGGTNDWHGEFGSQFRIAGLQAGPRTFLRRFAAGTVGSATNPFFNVAENIRPPKNEANDFFPTANLGGPILKDRLWFFGSYTPQFFREERRFNYVSSDPRVRALEAVETYRLKQRNEYAFFRLDAAVTDRMRLAGSYTWNPIIVEGAIPAFTDITSGAAGIPVAALGGRTLSGAEFLGQQGGRQNANLVTGKFDWTPTDNLIISVRGGRSYLNEKLGSYGIPLATRFQCSAAGIFEPSSGCVPGFQNFPSNFQIDFDRSIRKTVDADASYLVNEFVGRHQFKFGYQYNGISNETRQGYRNQGIVQLFYGLTLADIGVGLDTPGDALGVGLLQRFATDGRASSNSQAFFIQDSWQPWRRLTLNLGLRTERETVPSFADENEGIKFGFADKLAPRLGFALDLTGDGKTKLFGFYGWFYDRFKYELPRGSFGGDFFRRDYFIITPDNPRFDFYTLDRILGNFTDPLGGECPRPSGTGLSVCQGDFRIPSNRGLDFLFESGAVDPDLKAARQSEFTIGFERDLGGTFLFSSRYTHKQIDRAIEDIGLPTPEGSEAYIIGNPGRGLAAQTSRDLGYPVIGAVRDYDALELRVDKRFTRNYYFNASYTYSRLYGNYSGLASSDEILATGTGRASPNVNRFFDLPFIGFTANGEPDNGRLPTDRPHVFKFSGAYTFDWFGNAGHATEFSSFFTAQSGTPITSYYQFYSAQAVLFGRGDLGRTEAFTQTDFAIRHKYRMSERFTIAFDLDFINLFNEANELTRFTLISPSNLSGPALGITPTDEVTAIQRVFNGGIANLVSDFVNSAPNRFDIRYNQPNFFQGGREVRFGFRFLF